MKKGKKEKETKNYSTYISTYLHIYIPQSMYISEKAFEALEIIRFSMCNGLCQIV